MLQDNTFNSSGFGGYVVQSTGAEHLAKSKAVIDLFNTAKECKDDIEYEKFLTCLKTVYGTGIAGSGLSSIVNIFDSAMKHFDEKSAESKNINEV